MAEFKTWFERRQVNLDVDAPGQSNEAVLADLLDPGEATGFKLLLQWRVVSLEAAVDPTVRLFVEEQAVPGSGSGIPFTELYPTGELLARGESTVTVEYPDGGTRVAPSGTPLRLRLANSSATAGAVVELSAWVRWTFG